jgi:hypothetical protein
MASEWEQPCPACAGTGMRAVDDHWQRTCKHCFGSGYSVSIIDRNRPHAIDHAGYRDGAPRPEAMLALERADPFWKTLGGRDDDPWADGGETLRQRARAMSLGIGLGIYSDMVA